MLAISSVLKRFNRVTVRTAILKYAVLLLFNSSRPLHSFSIIVSEILYIKWKKHVIPASMLEGLNCRLFAKNTT